MMRFGQVIGVKPENLEAYKRHHAAVWPEILDKIRDCNIRNYSIYYKNVNGMPLLFAYFEYVGDDFEGDMARMAADPKTQEWWDIMMPLQQPIDTREEGEWWATMEEVFHTE
jgi:L-rhamnose mutarotase